MADAVSEPEEVETVHIENVETYPEKDNIESDLEQDDASEYLKKASVTPSPSLLTPTH
jgi:hypothetical protein